MAGNYRKNNKGGTIDVYLQRVIYGGMLNSIKKNAHRNITDFNFGEKILFGRVDMHYIPIVLRPKNINYLPNTAPGETQIGAVNFVIDAFKELSLQFEKAAATGKIASDDPFLSSLRAYKGYQNSSTMYAEYFKIYSRAIASAFRKEENPPVYFEQFMNKLLPMIKNSVRQQPFTRTGFVKSRRCPIACSGLAIEIADLSYANDQDKIDKFVNSKNWDFYVNACNAYGFMIDKDIPWRLIADIGNTEYLEQYAGPTYGIYQKQTLFNRFYDIVHEDYYAAFKHYLLKLYNISTPRFVKETEYCQRSGTQKHILSATETYDPNLFGDEISEEYFLRTYFKIRFMEEESQFTEEKQQQIIEDVIRLYNADNKNLNVYLFFFEFILNKTVDYVGSVSYIKTALRERRADDFRRGRTSPNTPAQSRKNSERELASTATQDGEPIGPLATDWWQEDPVVRAPWDPPLGTIDPRNRDSES